MEYSFSDRLKHAWNAFTNRDPTYSNRSYDLGYSYSRRPDRVPYTRGSERTIVASIINRIGLDAAAVNIQHCKLDDNGRFLEPIKSGLNNCLTLESNIDQSARSFWHDYYVTLLQEGHAVIVPVDTTFDPRNTEAFDIWSMRVGQVIEWYPQHVRIKVYNDKKGLKEEVVMPKRAVAIVQNPLYGIMNEPNSTLQRLLKKLSLLDAVDEQSSSGKLDLIIQLPYVIKSEQRRQQAEARRKDIEMQLSGTKYGIAYTDGTERITQLNRPIENNLLKQVEYLTSMAFSQLGMTQSILDGTADEKTMLNYMSRIIEPIVSVTVDEMKRKFLTKTARSQNKSIMFFRDPFKLVPVNDIAEIADKFTRNEIMTSNEIRQIVGLKPHDDPKADQLINSNLNHPDEAQGKPGMKTEPNLEQGGNIQNG